LITLGFGVFCSENKMFFADAEIDSVPKLQF